MKSRELDTINFYEWFIGFIEGDGCFSFTERQPPHTLEFSFSIKQTDRQVLKYIQEKLGFGQVYVTNKNGFEFRVIREEHLVQLIEICATRVERYAQFQNWVQRFDQQKNTTFAKQIAPASSITFETAWLAGLMQAEGYFRAQLVFRPKLKLRHSILLRFIFTQNNGKQIFQKIKSGLGCIHRDKKTYRLTIASQTDLESFILYFEKYPMIGRKKIAQDCWLRVYRLRAKKLALPPLDTLNYHRYRRLIDGVNLCQDRSLFAKKKIY